MGTTGGLAGDRDTSGGAGRASDPPRRTSASAEVAGHVRTGRLRSIRLRLLLPIMVATAGLIVLGAVQTQFAVSTSLDAGRARVMAGTATAAVRLEQRLEEEVAAVDALHARGGSAGDPTMADARTQTDLTVTRFRAVEVAARATAPALRPVLDAADRQLDRLPTIREAVSGLAADQLAGDRYAELSRSLIAVADALPTQLTDARLAATARGVAAVAAAEQLGAQQRDLLGQVFRRGSFGPGELVALGQLAGAQDERLGEFTRGATTGQLQMYRQIATSPDVTNAQRIRDAALAANADPAALTVDPATWSTAQTNALRHLDELQVTLSDTLDASSRAQQARARSSAILTGTATALLVVLAFGAALVFGGAASRRLRGLRGAALSIAYRDLPGAIARLSEADGRDEVRAIQQSSVARADQLTVRGGDEIAEVASALGAVHRQALRLASEQAALRLDIAGLFVALSRRGQSLIHRQLHLIDRFERNETDPVRLERLFALDHLAARMRRNEENLLVLAGGEPGRRVSETTSLAEVVQAAAAEIEDYARVDASQLVDIGVVPLAVRDVIHLLAELLENAANFSPPDTRVRVGARQAVEGVHLTVFDEGIGIPPGQVEQLNARLRRPTMLTAELAGTMGLLVVSRLAARHGIEVELRSTPGGGTAALVTVPTRLLAPVPLRPRALEASVSIRPLWALPAGPSSPALGVSEDVSTSAGGSSALPVRVELTDAGLPRRRPSGRSPAGLPSGEVPAGGPSSGETGSGGGSPGEVGSGGPPSGEVPSGGAVSPAATPDPEVVRARLSGLANGLAAAARRNRQGT